MSLVSYMPRCLRTGGSDEAAPRRLLRCMTETRIRRRNSAFHDTKNKARTLLSPLECIVVVEVSHWLCFFFSFFSFCLISHGLFYTVGNFYTWTISYKGNMKNKGQKNFIRRLIIVTGWRHVKVLLFKCKGLVDATFTSELCHLLLKVEIKCSIFRRCALSLFRRRRWRLSVVSCCPPPHLPDADLLRHRDALTLQSQPRLWMNRTRSRVTINDSFCHQLLMSGGEWGPFPCFFCYIFTRLL